MSEHESERLLRAYYERRLAGLGGRPGRPAITVESRREWRSARVEQFPRLTALIAAASLATLAAIALACPSARLEERFGARYAGGIAAAITIELEGSAFVEGLAATSASWPRAR